LGNGRCRFEGRAERQEDPEAHTRSESEKAATRILPMQLQLGDRLTDETGEWEIIGRPYTTNAGKDAHARVQKVGQPDVTEVGPGAAHERVSVKRASAEKGMMQRRRRYLRVDGAIYGG
jgi:hypothetical protein